MTNVKTRAEMAQLAFAEGATCILTEPGREGLFIFRGHSHWDGRLTLNAGVNVSIPDARPKIYAVTKTAGGSAYNAGASSTAPMKGDFIVWFRRGESTFNAYVGADSSASTGVDRASYDYGVGFGGTWLFAERNGSYAAPAGANPQMSDGANWIALRREAGVLTVLEHNVKSTTGATVKHTYPGTNNDDLYIHLAIYEQGASFTLEMLNTGRLGNGLVTDDDYQGFYVAPASDATGASGAWVRELSGVIELAWFGVADGAPNNAERCESAFALLKGGADFLLPRGKLTFNRDVYIENGLTLRGHGGSASDPGTSCVFPAGSSGFRTRYTAGVKDPYDCVIRDLKISHSGKLGTSATASFNAASRTITITGGTNDYVNGQVVRLEGAGESHTIVGKTAQITSGSNVAEITTNGGGNPGVYIGQHITIAGAGLPTGTKVTGVSPTTITLSSNATASVSGAAYTVIWPMVGTITSGGGTATLIVDAASETQNATGAALSHFDCGITLSRPAQIENVSFGGNHHCNLLMRADSSYGANVNTSQVRFSRFGSCDVCVVNAGFDSNASAFWGNDFSNYAHIGVLEVSLIGNFYFGNHFAFNVGIACPKASNLSLLIGNYFENGTSYPGNGYGNIGYGNQYLQSGFGWAGFQPHGAGIRLAEGLALLNADVSDAFYRGGVKVVGARGAAVADAAVATYVAPSGGSTVDAQARTAIAQLAADNSSVRAQLNALLSRVRTHGLIAP